MPMQTGSLGFHSSLYVKNTQIPKKMRIFVVPEAWICRPAHWAPTSLSLLSIEIPKKKRLLVVREAWICQPACSKLRSYKPKGKSLFRIPADWIRQPACSDFHRLKIVKLQSEREESSEGPCGLDTSIPVVFSVSLCVSVHAQSPHSLGGVDSNASFACHLFLRFRQCRCRTGFDFLHIWFWKGFGSRISLA